MTEPWNVGTDGDPGDEDPSTNVMRACAWLTDEIQRSIFDALKDAPIIPYNDAGVIFVKHAITSSSYWHHIAPPPALVLNGALLDEPPYKAGDKVTIAWPHDHWYSVPACERCHALPDPEFTDGKHVLCRACYDGLQLEPLALVDYPITKLFLRGLDTGNEGLCGVAVAYSYPLAQPCDEVRSLAEQRWAREACGTWLWWYDAEPVVYRRGAISYTDGVS